MISMGKHCFSFVTYGFSNKALYSKSTLLKKGGIVSRRRTEVSTSNWGRSFSTYAKFSEEMLFFWKMFRTY